MAVVCPTITATSAEDYKNQMSKVAHFAQRLHIDLTDGAFAPSKTVGAAEAWWPVGVKADFHVMYKDPVPAVREVLKHQPNLIIVHAEADGDFARFADYCRRHDVKVGVALLAKTPAGAILNALERIDHVLIFSGNLGYQGGSQADLKLLDKVAVLKRAKPELEIGWDGGVNSQNISQIIFGDVEVVNVGGFIQSAEDPEHAYQSLKRIADETGTT